MSKVFKFKCLIICLAFAVVLSITAFSTSYALWQHGGEETIAASINIGKWFGKCDIGQLSDAEITDILKEAGCIGEDGRVRGAVSNSGKIIKFGEPVDADIIVARYFVFG